MRQGRREAVLERLANDFNFYAEHALKIVDAQGRVIPFIPRPRQAKLAQALEAQRAAGKPMRARILKARKYGFSTQAQGMAIQRTTSRPNHLAMVVAQDKMTGAEVFGMGRGMWQRLPAEVRPPIAYERNTDDHKFLHFGEPSLRARQMGLTGLDSRLRIDTANEVAAGRGLTVRTLHLSESAHWKKPDKRVGLLAAVPDDSDTLIIDETTANGHNFWHKLWLQSEAGADGYLPVFVAWWEDDHYRLRFGNAEDAEEFVVGEPRDTAERLGIDEEFDIQTLMRDAGHPDREIKEALNWRRWAIYSKSDGSLDSFHQEYPSTPEEAFLSTGSRIFEGHHVRRVLKRCDETDPVMASPEAPGPAVGVFRPADETSFVIRRGHTITVPRSALWVPRSRLEPSERRLARWRLWAPPLREHKRPDGHRVPAGQYIIGVDPMGGEEGQDLAEHAIVVVDHRSLKQVAEWTGQVDHDELALEVLLIALHYNRALVVIERTGGYGLPVLRRMVDFRYPRVYQREVQDERTASRMDKLGWSTDPATLPMMQARAKELLRTDTDGVRSRKVAGQMLTYVRTERGKAEPEEGSRSDALLAWMIAELVAHQRPLRPDFSSDGATSYTRRTVAA